METSLSFTPTASGGVSYYPARWHVCTCVRQPRAVQ